MWSFPVKPSNIPGIVHVHVHRDGTPASFAEVIGAWREDPIFRAGFNDSLASTGAREFRWETPGTTAQSVESPFECVLVPSPELAKRADPSAFRDQLAAGKSDVVSFGNLSGDARLIVPRETGARDAYAHLGAFVRSAPASQRDAFWRAVGDAMHARVGKQCVWLSTAGAGVPWLHARLDDRPKYYAHAPYRMSP